MKLLFVVLLITCSLATLSAKAEDAAAHAANFKACVAQDPSWFGRWGQYLAGYDIYSAQNFCVRSTWWGISHASRMGCYIEGSWKTAGYYCVESGSGSFRF